MRRIVLFVLAGLAGCSEPVDSTIDITHDICTPLPLAATMATTIQRDGITAAIGLWHARGVSAPVLDEPATIEIRFEEAAAAFRGVYEDEANLIYINAGLTDASELAIVIAHELGHAFGLPHISDRPSLMNPGNTTTPPTEADLAALRALWGGCDTP